MTFPNAGLSLVLSGRVQGVLMRRSIKRRADTLGISGFAENRTDGSVRVLASGTRTALEAFLSYCKKGSMFSRVTSMVFQWINPPDVPLGFTIMRQGTYLADKAKAVKHLSKQVVASKNEGGHIVHVPTHVAIIPDGNRRWARMHNVSTFEGHKRGFERFIELLDEARRLHIPHLSAWGFSTENWKRKASEVTYLMALFKKAMYQFEKKLVEREVRFRHFGRKDRLPKELITALETLEAQTAHFTTSSFGLCLDYGGRDELVRAMQKLAETGTEISEASISAALDTADMPDPDFIIRTSGEMRTSGLMPWQGAYAELYFTSILFPDFGKKEFAKAIAEFGRRKRNFGA